MYLHLGNETVIKTENILGIFDLDTSTISKHTRNFLSVCEKENKVVNVSYELPKSFIVYNNNGKNTIYICQISSQTILKRMLSRKE